MRGRRPHHPSARVTSAVTRDAVASGARALLHVSEANEPALRVYSALGYRAASRKPWVFFNPSRSGLHYPERAAELEQGAREVALGRRRGARRGRSPG